MSTQRVYRKMKGVHNVCIGRRREYTTCVQEEDGSTQRVYRKTKGVHNVCTEDEVIRQRVYRKTMGVVYRKTK